MRSLLVCPGQNCAAFRLAMGMSARPAWDHPARVTGAGDGGRRTCSLKACAGSVRHHLPRHQWLGGGEHRLGRKTDDCAASFLRIVPAVAAVRTTAQNWGLGAISTRLCLFDAPKALVDKLGQVGRLIRSKGVSLWFVSQSSANFPMPCWGNWATGSSMRCGHSRSKIRRHLGGRPRIIVLTHKPALQMPYTGSGRAKPEPCFRWQEHTQYRTARVDPSALQPVGSHNARKKARIVDASPLGKV